MGWGKGRCGPGYSTAYAVTVSLCTWKAWVERPCAVFILRLHLRREAAEGPPGGRSRYVFGPSLAPPMSQKRESHSGHLKWECLWWVISAASSWKTLSQ